MTPLEALKRITKFTEEKIAPQLLMRKEDRPTGDVMDKSEVVSELVNPVVRYGSIPHKNFQPLDFQIPLILWDFDQMSDDKQYTDGRTVNLRAFVGAYSSDIYESADMKLPDHKAFDDLLNTLEKMYVELTRRQVINGVGIKDSIEYGKYDGAYYPYAYGWLTITAEISRMTYDDEIDLDLDNC
jgi:hypothetical protein